MVNTYPEKLPATAGKPYGYCRVPGLRPWGTSTGTNYRGALLVINTIYAVISNTVYTFPAGGGAGTALPGVLPGTAPVTMARNNRQSSGAPTPDVVIVAPGDGAFIVTTGGVAAYPDSDVGQPNAVVFHKSFYLHLWRRHHAGRRTRAMTNINTFNFAAAESKPDTLYRPIPLGNGQLLACGSNSLEVWGGDVNLTGFPFSYVATIARGIVGINAIAGHDDGWGKGIFLVGDDMKVSKLERLHADPHIDPRTGFAD